MAKFNQMNSRWDLYSRYLIVFYALLQFVHLPLLPRFMDIYYHILTGWGFIQAGGYVGWDFWQYAPVGRLHIYPPLIHIILALLMKLGVGAVVLAKTFEVVMPVLFLSVLWRFVKKNYSESLAFFVLLAVSASLSYYLSLINHIPATLAAIFGLFAIEQVFFKKVFRAAILLAAMFYTHIGVSWFFALALVFYGIADKELRRACLSAVALSVLLALPMVSVQLSSAKVISVLGFSLNERYQTQIKIVDYCLAAAGIFLVLRKPIRFRLFISFLLASLIFLVYPYRFFSAEGYLPIIFLSAVALKQIYEKSKIILALVLMVTIVLSPSISLKIPDKGIGGGLQVTLNDSAFLGLLNAKGKIMWYPNEYLPAAEIIKKHSEGSDIVYSTHITGFILASLSGRATAGALLPEIKASKPFDPFAGSKIIIFTQGEDPQAMNSIISSHGLVKISENKLFLLYKNPACSQKADIRRATVPFWAILLICGLFLVLFLKLK